MEPLIREYPDWQAATAEQLLEWFQEEFTVPSRDAHRNGSQLQLLLGIDAANAFAAALAPTNPLLIGSLNQVDGIDFSLPEVREKLLQLKESVPEFAGLCDVLLSLGSTTKTRWAMHYAEAPLPTVDAIAATLEMMRNRVFNLTRVLLSVSSGEQTTASVLITPMSQDGFQDENNSRRIVLTNGVFIGNPTKDQAAALSAIVELVNSLKA